MTDINITTTISQEFFFFLHSRCSTEVYSSFNFYFQIWHHRFILYYIPIKIVNTNTNTSDIDYLYTLCINNIQSVILWGTIQFGHTYDHDITACFNVNGILFIVYCWWYHRCIEWKEKKHKNQIMIRWSLEFDYSFFVSCIKYVEFYWKFYIVIKIQFKNKYIYI